MGSEVPGSNPGLNFFFFREGYEWWSLTGRKKLQGSSPHSADATLILQHTALMSFHPRKVVREYPVALKRAKTRVFAWDADDDPAKTRLRV